ncbi:DUF1295-domain-containing protein [Sporormia fimetaria CBS 119925]|uniref:DUF1295-domain-containing protein n=1 Tax=Sporormia fimetaria CBS 119925 TaxID=1340428 RepID=A0A6A6V2R8_9PLEO|nr:DUF1295-domain-containing protein [Sporormia fimetaria CBS 119925]
MLVPHLATALPVVKTLPECADFVKTVGPYIPQLYTLPQQVYAHITDLGTLKNIYLYTNPLITAFALAIFFIAPLALIAGEVNKNYSQIDRFWSIIPVVFNAHYSLWAHMAGFPTHSVDRAMAVSVIWGARLTFNYWRKGGYQIGSEDYRWVTVRKYAGNWMFLFNVLFISFGQSLLLFLITTPTYVLLLTNTIPSPAAAKPSTYTQTFPYIILTLVAIEYIADQQQWTFHQAKHGYQSTAQVPKQHNYTRAQLDRGFNTTGLFAYSRHPNFAAEQAVWVALYQWCCCESFVLWNWTVVGAASYLLLFWASTKFTEFITAGKYPAYRVYQQRVGKFLPKARTRSMEEGETGEEKRTAEKMEGREAKVKDALKGKKR